MGLTLYGLDPYLPEVIWQAESDEFNDLYDLMDGTFVSQVWPCAEIQCNAGASKGCFSIGCSWTLRYASDIVGEYYENAYGGIDG